MNITGKIVAGAALALAAGCVETAGTRVDIDTQTGEASVMECSRRLASKVRVYDVRYDTSAAIRKAMVKIESLVHRRLELQARMVWTDDEGIDIDPDGKPFRPIVLDGLDVTSFTGVSPNPRGVKARVQIRETDTAQ